MLPVAIVIGGNRKIKVAKMKLFKEKNHSSLLVVSILVVLSLFLAGYAPAFENEPDGFRGITWGMNIKDLDGMIFVERSQASDVYSRIGDKMSIGKAEVKKILYSFYKGRFYFVTIQFQSHANYLNLNNVFFRVYGVPSSIDENSCHWRGKDIDILSSFDKDSGYGVAAYRYRPIYNEKEGGEDL